MKICSKCGKKSDSKFCPDCGTLLNDCPEVDDLNNTGSSDKENNVKATTDFDSLCSPDLTSKNDMFCGKKDLEEKPSKQNDDTHESNIQEKGDNEENTSVDEKNVMASSTEKKKVEKNFKDKLSLFSFKDFLKRKPVKIASIVVGVIVVLSIIFATLGYVLSPSVKDDFKVKSKAELHSLTYYVPKEWKAQDESIWDDGDEENSNTYVCKKDGEDVIYMEVSYQGENTDNKVDDILDKYADEDSFSGATLDNFYTESGVRVDTLSRYRKSEGYELYMGIVCCDDSLFSFEFYYDSTVKGTEIFNKIIEAAQFDKYDNPKVITKLSATYDGETKAGTKIEYEDIVVTAEYDIGGSESVTGWKLLNPGTLEADKTSAFNIEYEGVKCVLNIECSTVSENGYKAKCKTFPYDALSRNPDNYEDQYIKVSGRVVQASGSSYRVATKGNYDDIVYVTFYNDSNSRILEDDKVTVYGKYYGVYTYTSVMGASITIPKIDAEYID